MASYTGIIYLITNTINGKIYVGQTTSTRHSYYGSGAYIKKAIKLYGKENFKRTILVDNIKLPEQANTLEKFYIKLYNSQSRKIGYNIRDGGKGGTFEHTESSKQKIKERSNKEDNRLRIRAIQRIASNKRVGTHVRHDVKLNTMYTKFGVNRKIEIYNKELELLNICDFSEEASKLTGVKRAGISNNLCGLAKSAGGFIFKYKILN